MTHDWRLAVDIGGTFTDVVLLDASTGTVVVDKTLTTPSNPLDGVRTGVEALLARAGVRPEDIIAPIVHATTLITNALIEGKTGRAALVTTAGFGDTLLIRDEHRYDMYDLQIEFPPPPIPRSLTFEIDERTAADGTTLLQPDSTSLARLTQSLRDAKVEAVAVCLLNSYVNAAQRTARGGPPPQRTRRAGVHLVGGLAADPRVPAHGHDGVQRGHHAGDRPVPRRAAEVARRQLDSVDPC